VNTGKSVNTRALSAPSVPSVTPATPVAATAQRVIEAFQRQFPERVRAAYLLGSYADQTAAPTSDLDVTLIFAGAFSSPEERAAAQRLARACAETATMEVDLAVEDEATLARGVSLNLKFASALLYGDENLRDQAPLVAIEAWTRDRMHSSWWRIARLFARPSPLGPHLDYPEPDTEFLGYVGDTRRTVRLADGREVPCTRDLIRLIGWAATGLLALECDRYVPSKREARILYAAHIGDEWTSLINDVYLLCRTRWNYLIPDEPSERARLHGLCEQTVRFERHFLARYLPYLLNQLHGPGEQVCAACEAMVHAPLEVAEVRQELTRLAASGGDMSDLASRALAAYTPATETR
jgi:predicted nucleotidyltransferase